jgi:N-formylglutamate amidohydrolase
MTDTAFIVHSPRQHSSCVVFASPHSGRNYEGTFGQTAVLDNTAIRSSEDAYVDLLFDSVAEFGAHFIAACVPRAYVDLNRSAEELDPALIEGVRRLGHNPRIASGLGVIPRVVANGRAIYRGKMTMTEAQSRLDQYWHPYHNRLQGLLDQAIRHHGQAVLVDCHSMPHEAMDGVALQGHRRPDVVLGDRFGAAAGGEVVDRIEAAFASAGFAVTRNAPFAGAYVTQAYGRPTRGQHAVQVEIDRSLYMDEKLVQPNADFNDIRDALRRVAAEVAQIGSARIPLAAE